MQPKRVELIGRLEALSAEGLFIVEQRYRQLSKEGNKSAESILEDYTNQHAINVVKSWFAFGESMISQYSDGYYTTGEEDGQQQQPGYPKWWLQHTDYIHNGEAKDSTVSAFSQPAQLDINAGDQNGSSLLLQLSLLANIVCISLGGYWYRLHRKRDGYDTISELSPFYNRKYS